MKAPPCSWRTGTNSMEESASASLRSKVSSPGMPKTCLTPSASRHSTNTSDALHTLIFGLEPFDYSARKHVQRQIVRSAGLGVGAAETVAPEGLHADKSARYAPVEVDVACLELGPGLFQVVAVPGIDAAGEPIGGVVGCLEGLVEVASPQDREDGAEDLFPRYPRLRVHLAIDCRLHEVSLIAVAGVLPQNPLGLLVADLDVVRHLLELGLVLDRSHKYLGVIGDSDVQGASLLDHLLEHLIVDVLVEDCAAGSAALLARVSVGALYQVFGGGVEVCRVIHDQGVLTARLDDNTLDPALPFLLLGG